MADRIKLFIVDIDGTMTNGVMTFNHEGRVSKGYHTRDVTALYLLQQAGIEVLMLTGSQHDCDRYRFAFLTNAVPALNGGKTRPLDHVLVQGIHDKVAYTEELLKAKGLSWDEVAFIGDAENDLGMFRCAGWSACPQDALPLVKQFASHVMHFPGGNGAVREFADLIIRTMERIHG